MRASIGRPLGVTVTLSIMAGLLAGCGGGHRDDNFRGGSSAGAAVAAPAAAPIAMAPPAAPDATRKFAECVNRAAYLTGAVETAEYRDTEGFTTTTVTTRQTISGPVPLNALQLQRADLRTTSATAAATTVQDDFQLFAVNGDDSLSYQITSAYPASASLPAGTVTVSFDQPLFVIPGSLTLGASRTVTSGATLFDSRTNSSSRLSYSQTFTFEAIEPVTVAAGAFASACRIRSTVDITGDFGRDTTRKLRWFAAGSGVELRSTDGVRLTSELVSATFNGVPVRP